MGHEAVVDHYPIDAEDLNTHIHIATNNLINFHTNIHIKC